MTGVLRKKENEISISGILIILFSFLAPLESFFSTEVGSLLKFYSIGCIFVFIAEIFITKRIKNWSYEIALLIGFFALLGLSVLWSGHIVRGVDTFFSVGLQIVFISVAVLVPYSKREKHLMLLAVAASTLVLSVLLLTKMSVEDMEIARQTLQTNGQDIDPNNIGALIVCGVAVLLPMKFRNNVLNIFKYIAVIALVTACLYTASRSAAVSLVIVFLYNIFAQRKFEKKSTSMLSVLFIAVVVYVIAISFLTVNPFDLLMSRFMDDTGGSGRTLLWKISFESISQRPFFGYGLAESPYVIGKQYVNNIGSHNTYITIWFESGIFALSVFVIFILSLWHKRKNDFFNISVFGMLLAALTTSFFIDTYNKKILWLPILLCIITVADRHKTNKNKLF